MKQAFTSKRLGSDLAFNRQYNPWTEILDPLGATELMASTVQLRVLLLECRLVCYQA